VIQDRHFPEIGVKMLRCPSTKISLNNVDIETYRRKSEQNQRFQLEKNRLRMATHSRGILTRHDNITSLDEAVQALGKTKHSSTSASASVNHRLSPLQVHPNSSFQDIIRATVGDARAPSRSRQVWQREQSRPVSEGISLDMSPIPRHQLNRNTLTDMTS